MYPQAVIISSDLISYLRDLYATGFNDVILRNGDESNINGYTKHAVPGYILSVTAIEAFLNEMFLSRIGRKLLKNSTENAAFWEALESTSLIEKLAFIPQIFFGKAFDIGAQPYQGMKELIAVRNELVHYKMSFKQPTCFKILQQRKIALSEKGQHWTYNISSLEGMRWAHNTICSTIQTLIGFATQDTHPILTHMQSTNFYNPWPDDFIKMKAKEILAKRNS